MITTVKINDKVFRDKLYQLSRKLGKSTPQLIKEQGALLARDFAGWTPPYDPKRKGRRASYGSRKDKKLGELSVARDIRKAMTPITKKWKDPRIANLVSEQNVPVLQKIFQHSKLRKVRTFSPDLHKNARNMRGRVTRNQNIGVVPEDRWQNYVRKKQRNVGMAKAAFAKAAKDLGAKRIPKWISKHFPRVSGSGYMIKDKANIRASAHGLESAYARRNFITQSRTRALIRRMSILLKNKVKEAKLRTK